MQKRISLAAAICFSLLAVVFLGEAVAQLPIFEKGLTQKPAARHVPGEIIVKFKPGIRGEAVRELNQRHGCSVLSTSRFAGFKRLRIPKGKTVEQMVNIYSRNPNIEYAEPNYIAYAFFVSDDPLYDYQWHLDNDVHGGINMEAAWDLSNTPGEGVTVAVIDTGVAYEDYQELVRVGRSGKYSYITYELAPDLAETEFAQGYDFVNNDFHPNDDEGHGTHVTGTIAQTTNNGLGVAGVAFNCTIMPIKVLDKNGSGTYADIADGIYHAANNGAKIINMSLGGSSGSITLENALEYAHGKDVTIVCASGNDGSTTTVSYPAAYDVYCIAVGATRYDEAVAYYSNGGPSLDLTAPGGDIGVDQNGDEYGDGVLQQTFGNNPTDWGYWFYQGTSMAAPHVSGVAALLIAEGVATTPVEVREALQSRAKDIGEDDWDAEYGWGIVDAYAALNYTSGFNTPPEANAGGPYQGVKNTPITFNGSESHDLNEDSLTYSWEFGDGGTGSGSVATHVYSIAGIYTITLTVTDTGGLTGSDITQVAVTEEPTSIMDMHIDSIDMALKRAGINTIALATVTIVDANGSPVDGATVEGSWSDATSDMDLGVTDANGQVILVSDRVKRAPSGTTFTFSVDSVTKDGWTYDEDASGSIPVP